MRVNSVQSTIYSNKWQKNNSKTYTSNPIFTSNKNELAIEAEKYMTELITKTLEKNGDILGKNVVENIIKPFEKFLASKGNYWIKVKDNKEISCRTHPLCLNWGSVKDGYRVDITSRAEDWAAGELYVPNRNFNAPSGFGGLTKNSAILNMLNEINNGNAVFESRSALKYDEIPKDIIKNNKEVNLVINDFLVDWLHSPHDDDNIKLKRLQSALKVLLGDE